MNKNFSLKQVENQIEKSKAPGPTTYNQDDRILHEKLREQTWGKMQEERTFNKPVRGDYRKQLLPDLDAVKPNPKGAVIPKEHIMTDFEIDKLYDQMVGPGPASFKPSHALTEKRADVGIVKIQKIDESKVKEEVDDKTALYPNYKPILPNHMTFKYFEPSKDIGPKHAPEKEKFPGQWKYYDVNLDAIKDQVSTNVYLGGAKDLTKEEYEEKEDFLNLLHTYLDRINNKKPSIG